MTDRLAQQFTLLGFNPLNSVTVKSTVHQNADHSLGKVVFELLDPNELVLLPLHQNEHLRKIGLWNETCFEIFLKLENGHYIEGNFNLSFNWNMFYFKSYRETPLTEWSTITTNPIKDVLLSRDKSLIIIDFPEEVKTFLRREKIVALSLTAVLKTKDGETHYFAIKHADLTPNFHHPESFVPFTGK